MDVSSEPICIFSESKHNIAHYPEMQPEYLRPLSIFANKCNTCVAICAKMWAKNSLFECVFSCDCDKISFILHAKIEKTAKLYGLLLTTISMWPTFTVIYANTYPMIMFIRIWNKPTRKHRRVVDGLAEQRMVCDIVDIWFFYPSVVGEKVGRCLSKGCSIWLNMAWYIWRDYVRWASAADFFFCPAKKKQAIVDPAQGGG